ncbi:MAG: hypothetical protein RJA70_4024 [Pseudomonadota bacterium]|jgi:OOP family OmpA-OmpF porin
MNFFAATRRVGFHSAWLVVLLASACGGVTQFSDRTAIAIAGTPAPKPVEAKMAPMRVEMRDNQIVINEKVQFAYNDAEILEVSFSLLNEVADVIKKNPHVKVIEVGGHASSEGSDSHNLRLSKRRAKAVMTYLVEKAGVEQARLTSQGFGETKPLVTPDETEADRERNRRVEFLILEQDVTQKKVEVDPNTGKEKVLDTAVKSVGKKEAK